MLISYASFGIHRAIANIIALVKQRSILFAAHVVFRKSLHFEISTVAAPLVRAPPMQADPPVTPKPLQERTLFSVHDIEETYTFVLSWTAPGAHNEV